MTIAAARAAIIAVAALLLAGVGCSADDPHPTDSGSSTCEETPCLRANECVATCDGPVLYSGCCPCAEGQLDRVVECPPPGDAGADAEDTST
ncbi:MAG: hypothetical protein JRH11_23735 [Deltaproteobacteria bacterium]|nr:hypothetical protein [Deltaproteobacteria bacterium]